MNIPKQVKIGGITYAVEISDSLKLDCNFTAEIQYSNLKIVIRPQAEQKMQADFLHELTHGIYNHLGYKNHDEKQIDELAQALFMVITDNPKMFLKNKKTS